MFVIQIAYDFELLPFLSNRQTRDSHFSPIQQSCTDPNIPKQVQNKPKNRINVKRQQQLKKLDEIAYKYNQRLQHSKDKVKADDNNDEGKSQIPVFKKKGVPMKEKMKNVVNSAQSVKEDIKRKIVAGNKNKITASPVRNQNESRTRPKQVKKNTKGNSAKESTMSLDSLDEDKLNSNNEKYCQSVEMNTELLCPSVPCKIYACPEQKRTEHSTKKSKTKDSKTNNLLSQPLNVPIIKLLYKNPNVNDNCDVRPKEINTTQINYSDIVRSDSNNSKVSVKIDSSSELKSELQNISEAHSNNGENTISPQYSCQGSLNKQNSDEKYDDLYNLSAEEFDDNYEHDLSADLSNDSVEQEDIGQANKDISRHGSSETYTKFSEEPADLEEFYNLTDKIISSKTVDQKVDEDVNKLHTPNSVSLEALNRNESNLVHISTTKHKFSDTLEELKHNLKEILNVANDDKIKNDNTQRDVHDMEHITVFGLKFYEENNSTENKHCGKSSIELKLPSISETNNMMQKEQCIRNKLKASKTNRKYVAFDKQNRNNIEYKTFIVNDHQDDNSDGQSISSEAPPLKLPRIELKRLFCLTLLLSHFSPYV